MMRKDQTLGEYLREQGVSRRGFLKYCSAVTSLMALPPSAVAKVAEALASAKRPSVIWLSFQECTGCTESLTRSHAPTVESLIFDAISLDYHHTLQAAAGHGAEAAREAAMAENEGEYILVVDGSIPVKNKAFSTIAGISNYDMLVDVASKAYAVVAVGTCAAFGGLPMANPNPTGAVSVSEIERQTYYQRVGLPTNSCSHYRCSGPFPDVWNNSRTRRVGSTGCFLWSEYS